MQAHFEILLVLVRAVLQMRIKHMGDTFVMYGETFTTL